jgi:hypothetical protein
MIFLITEDYIKNLLIKLLISRTIRETPSKDHDAVIKNVFKSGHTRSTTT